MTDRDYPAERIKRYVTALNNADTYAQLSTPADRERLARAVMAVADAETDRVYKSGYDTGVMHSGAGRIAAERDCLAMAVLFARQWSGGTPFELHKGIDEVLATMPADDGKSSRQADAVPDFFQPGHTYAYDANGFTAPELLTVFRVVADTTHPDTGKRTAFGWMRTAEDVAWSPYSEPADEWPTCWTDITDTTQGDSK